MNSMVKMMIQPKSSRHRSIVAVYLIGLLGCAACAPAEVLAPGPTASPPLPATAAATACEQILVPPQIMEIQPAEPVPGSEITVIGSGGYVQDTCGGFMEGARSFKLYLDNETIGDLSCYVNRCEARATLPGNLSAGTRCLSTEIEACAFEFQVIIQ